ncbi:MAG: hypothetical protein U9O65_05545 [Thermotogota bacterium]|nr:hypothetical protein [Thermotogota bacterium]
MATGLDRPFGFEVWDELIRSNLYAVPTAPTIGIYHNDIVRHGGAHLSTAKGGHLPIVEDGAVPDGNAALLGTVLAIFDENMDPVSRIIPAETGDSTVAGYVMVADSPDQLFVAQEDSDSNAITLTEGGQNADLVSVALCAGTATTGISTQEIDSDTAGTGAALNLKIVRPHPKDTPTEDYCRYIVQINEHYYGDTMAGL